jgi:hypothetical protein
MLAGTADYNTCTLTYKENTPINETSSLARTVTITITNITNNYQVASIRYSDAKGRSSYFNNILISGKNVYYPTTEMVRLNNGSSSDEYDYFDYIQSSLSKPLMYMSEYSDLLSDDISTANISASFYKTDTSGYSVTAMSGKRVVNTSQLKLDEDENDLDSFEEAVLGLDAFKVPATYMYRGLLSYTADTAPWTLSTAWGQKPSNDTHAYLEIFVKPKEVNSEGLCTSGAWYRPDGIKVPIKVKFEDDKYYIKILNNNTIHTTDGWMAISDYNGQVTFEKISATHVRLTLPIS